MSSPCCDTLDTPPPTPAGTLTVALAGNPNSGKTTLFNALTGLRQKVANYPGVTVEKKTGRCKLPNGQWSDIIDLPGTYSLISRSPDEQVAMEVLRGLRKDTKTPDVVIVVVDASNLQRNLYLVSQLIELGRPLVVALNMMDIAKRRGLHVSADNLQKELGVPVDSDCRIQGKRDCRTESCCSEGDGGAIAGVRFAPGDAGRTPDRRRGPGIARSAGIVCGLLRTHRG